MYEIFDIVVLILYLTVVTETEKTTKWTAMTRSNNIDYLDSQYYITSFRTLAEEMEDSEMTEKMNHVADRIDQQYPDGDISYFDVCRVAEESGYDLREDDFLHGMIVHIFATN